MLCEFIELLIQRRQRFITAEKLQKLSRRGLVGRCWLTIFSRPSRSYSHRRINLLHRLQPRRQRPLHPRRKSREMFTSNMYPFVSRNSRAELTEADKGPCSA